MTTDLVPRINALEKSILALTRHVFEAAESSDGDMMPEESTSEAMSAKLDALERALVVLTASVTRRLDFYSEDQPRDADGRFGGGGDKNGGLSEARANELHDTYGTRHGADGTSHVNLDIVNRSTAAQFAKDHGVRMDNVQKNGPGGGNSTADFHGDRGAITKMLDDYENG